MSNDRKVEVFVVSHLDSLLEALPKLDSLTRVNLEKLVIPAEFVGNHLAESRFFFSELASTTDADVVGFVSARWHERFPDLPELDEMANLASRLEEGQYFAPMLSPVLTRTGLKTWMAMQELEHPGMGKLLRSAVESHGRISRKQKLGYSVMGGQIFTTKENFHLMLKFVAERVVSDHSKYGLYPPFKYACSTCGRVFRDGVGRWNKTRHFGFLAERYLSLFFILNAQMIPITFDSKGHLSPITPQGRKLEVPFWVHVSYARLVRLKNRLTGGCAHNVS
jgi:hypothetical protein